MLRHSKEYNNILYGHFKIKTNFNPPTQTIINMIQHYDYLRNDIQETILFLELMHDLLIKNID